MIHLLTTQNSLLNRFIAELRDEKIQKDSMRFRRNLERIGEIMAYEISQTLDYEEQSVQSPLGTALIPLLKEKIVLATVLRAGLPLHQGLLNYFDTAENAFITAFRKHHRDGSFEIESKYLSAPSIEEKILIISDPMLATGASMVTSYASLLEKGIPKHTHIVTVVASREGIAHVQKNLSMQKVSIWVGAVDEELTVKAYIVPGLGDAGDLAFGGKE